MGETVCLSCDVFTKGTPTVVEPVPMSSTGSSVPLVGVVADPGFVWVPVVVDGFVPFAGDEPGATSCCSNTDSRSSPCIGMVSVFELGPLLIRFSEVIGIVKVAGGVT